MSRAQDPLGRRLASEELLHLHHHPPYDPASLVQLARFPVPFVWHPPYGDADPVRDPPPPLRIPPLDCICPSGRTDRYRSKGRIIVIHLCRRRHRDGRLNGGVEDHPILVIRLALR